MVLEQYATDEDAAHIIYGGSFIEVGPATASIAARNMAIYQGNDCPTDFNFDGAVDGGDLTILLGSWGTPDADVTGNGDTDGGDLTVLLGNWGLCP